MKVIVFLIILAALIYFGYTRNEAERMQQTRKEESAQKKQQTRGAGSVSQTSSSVASSPLPASASLEQNLKALARKNGVRVSLGSAQGNSVRVRVEWTGDVATIGGDYIMALFRAKIIRDFDTVGSGRRGSDAQGRSVWSQDYDLKLR